MHIYMTDHQDLPPSLGVWVHLIFIFVIFHKGKQLLRNPA